MLVETGRAASIGCFSASVVDGASVEALEETMAESASACLSFLDLKKFMVVVVYRSGCGVVDGMGKLRCRIEWYEARREGWRKPELVLYKEC